MVCISDQFQRNSHHRNSGGGRGLVGGERSGGRRNVPMILQHQHNGEKDNHSLVPGQDINTVNAQCCGFHKWGHLAFNLPNNNNNGPLQVQGCGKKWYKLFSS